MSPVEEEKVTFRIASNVRARRAAEAAGGLAAIHSGRRAVQVWRAQPGTAKHSCNTLRSAAQCWECGVGSRRHL